MARRQFHVSPDGSGWNVTGGGGVFSRHASKQPAVAAGVDVARRYQPSQLIIHLADGRIEEERTYGRDPFPPRG